MGWQDTHPWATCTSLEEKDEQTQGSVSRRWQKTLQTGGVQRYGRPEVAQESLDFLLMYLFLFSVYLARVGARLFGAGSYRCYDSPQTTL